MAPAPGPAAVWRLRAGSLADATACAALIAAFQRDLTDDPDGRGAEGYLASVSAEAERGYLASPRYAYLLAFGGAAPDAPLQGFIAIRDRSHLFHLFVDRAAQGRGLASRLWRKALADARARGGDGAMTVNSSLAAVPVYRAFGFAETSPVTRQHGIAFQPMRRLASADPSGDLP